MSRNGDMMKSMEKFAILRKTEMFGSLTKNELLAVSKVCSERRMKKSETLFWAGEEAQGMYVIGKGSLRAYRTNEGGREQTIHVEKAGSTIAEVPVFDGKPYPSTVTAETEAELLFIPKKDVLRLCLDYPAIALSALKLLASRLRKTAALAEALSLKEVDQRLASFLLQEFAEKGLKKIPMPTYSDIAARLGTVREVISRSMAKLKREKLVSVDKEHTLTIMDAQGLRRYAGG